MRSPHLLLANAVSRPALARRIVCGLAALALAALYAATLQTHISGSFGETSPQNILHNEYIKDVAEIQVALTSGGRFTTPATRCSPSWATCSPSRCARWASSRPLPPASTRRPGA